MDLKKVLWTNIPEIDKQHAQFIMLLEKLEGILKRKYSRDEIEEIVIAISEYARKHFDTEEKYFKKYNYPKSTEHEIEHIKLIEKVNILYDGLLYGNTEPKELLFFLLNWFDDHLKKSDKEYSDYFNKIKIPELEK
jgi:hemerythrin